MEMEKQVFQAWQTSYESDKAVFVRQIFNTPSYPKLLYKPTLSTVHQAVKFVKEKQRLRSSQKTAGHNEECGIDPRTESRDSEKVEKYKHTSTLIESATFSIPETDNTLQVEFSGMVIGYTEIFYTSQKRTKSLQKIVTVAHMGRFCKTDIQISSTGFILFKNYPGIIKYGRYHISKNSEEAEISHFLLCVWIVENKSEICGEVSRAWEEG